MGETSPLDNTLLDGLDSLYSAYARVSAIADEDPDWAVIAERLGEAMARVESAVRVMAAAGLGSLPTGMKQILYKIETAVNARDIATAATYSRKLEEATVFIKTISSLALRQACAYRIATALSIIIAVALIPAAGVVQALLGMASIGLAIAGILGCLEYGSSLLMVLSLVPVYALIVYAYPDIIQNLSPVVLGSIIIAWLGAIVAYIDLKATTSLYYRIVNQAVSSRQSQY